jgi:hypothetical protein
MLMIFTLSPLATLWDAARIAQVAPDNQGAVPEGVTAKHLAHDGTHERAAA